MLLIVVHTRTAPALVSQTQALFMYQQAYLDKDGYYRFKSNNGLVHREIAYTEIYLPNKKSYRLPFKDYTVHHKNLRKKDNRPRNLEILTETEHKRLHQRLRNRRHQSIAGRAIRFVFLD